MTSDAAKKSPNKHWNIELVVAGVLGILAITTFVAQVATVGEHTTAMETFLFNCLQFILTTGFAWFSTRAASRNEFEESLKKFAISAYRRAADIERMVDRLHSESVEILTRPSQVEVTDLRVIRAMAADTGQLVRSSISDWGDVIGEELLAMERIKRLEREKERLHSEEETSAGERKRDEATKRIEEAIEAIQRSLPPRLQLETESEERAEQSTRAAQWIAGQHRRHDGLPATVVTGGIYLHERDYQSLKPGEILTTSIDEDGGIDVRDLEGRGVGRLLNVTPLNYTEFAKALRRCYGDHPLTLEFIEVSDQKVEPDGNYAWLEVRVRNILVRRRRGEPSKRSSPCASE